VKTFFLGLLLAVAGFGADIAGKWAGPVEGLDEDSPKSAVFLFQTEGGQLTGKGGSGEGRMAPFRNLKVDGNKVTFEVANDDVVAKVEMVVDGDVMTGEARVAHDGQNIVAKLRLKRER
jgi:hypothetical protein